VVWCGPGGGDHKAKSLRPVGIPYQPRKGANVRHVYNIMLEDETARRTTLLVVEVITPQGNTSSHPHTSTTRTTCRMKACLKKTYHHRLNPPAGFWPSASIPTTGALDEAMAVEDGDVTLVPRRYHPVATTAGCSPLFNVMVKFQAGVEVPQCGRALSGC
jgi:5-deoxy-glucuronate isomerase